MLKNLIKKIETIKHYAWKLGWVVANLVFTCSYARAITDGGTGMGIENPIKSQNLLELLDAIINIIIMIGIPVIVIMIVWAGWMFIQAQGNPTKLQTARAGLMWVFIGTMVVLGAKVIVEIVQNTMFSIKGP